ncbi:uncharacterized protein I206_100388 [Kwoniella pini CBS 10737]|uniref:Uncharacterized protein n=1 Tax=Kwoniella pini CBS 10737 TaxID=1296096 RepID=A0A1B9IEC6_9TREE|nr:uncharacterized protein I206_00936 [Kwoniella pini CBS 10737]OCF53630.1 hypothetical protein I206_00936 [Kwoniella pini CBS 10737]
MTDNESANSVQGGTQRRDSLTVNPTSWNNSTGSGPYGGTEHRRNAEDFRRQSLVDTWEDASNTDVGKPYEEIPVTVDESVEPQTTS